MEEEAPDLRAVHVLISDDFFWDKVDGTLRALEKQPLTPNWDEDIAQQVLEQPACAVVLDLEDPSFATLGLLESVRGDKRTRDLAVLAYCSHHRQDLMTAATELGAEVVPRSTFAARLVSLLKNLGQEPED